MFSSLRSRLWLSYALVIAAALSVVAVVLLVFLLRNPFLYRQTLDRLEAAETLITDRPKEFLADSQSLERLAQSFNVRILVFNSDRNLLMDTSPGDAQLPFPRKQLVSRNIPALRDAKGRLWLYTSSRLPNGAVLAVVAPRPRVQLLNIFADELLVPILEGGMIAFLLSLLLAFVIARWVANPLQEVVAASQRLPFDEIWAISPRGPREVQVLTRAFNSMIARVQSSQKSQRDFVANVSHELKTPLTSIQGFAQAILDGTADSPDARRQAAEIIHNEAGRMHRMALDLLDLARLEAGTADIKMSPVDVGALLRGVAEKFTPQAQRAQVTLQVNISDTLPVLTGDGDRLAQVFTNLVDNALKFTSAGGQIMLSAELSGAEMEFQVQDTGKGVPAESLPRLFDRFYQADSSRAGGDRHGTGLGLAIVQEIVGAHGGRISVRSQVGQGTTFIIRLPLAQADASTLVRRKK